MKVSLSLIYLIISLVVSHFGGNDAHPASGGSSEDTSSEEYLDATTVQINGLKNELIPCRNLLIVTNSLSFLDIDRKFMDQGLRKCEIYFSELIERIIDDLGLIGDSIRRWLIILNDYLLESDSEIITDNSDIKRMASLRQKLDPMMDEHENADQKYYLETAYLYGLGICTHVNHGPLATVLFDLKTFWLYKRLLDESLGKGRHEFVFLDEIENKLYKEDLLHPFIVTKALSHVCKSLANKPMAEHIFEILRVAGMEEARYQMHLNTLVWQNHISFQDIENILRLRSDSTCKQADYHRFQEGLRYLFSLGFGEHSREMIHIKAGAGLFIQSCLARLAPLVISDGISLTPDDLETYEFSVMVREQLNTVIQNEIRHSSEPRPDHTLVTRNLIYPKPAERIFFDVPKKSKFVNADSAIAAYKDGTSGPCEFFASKWSLYGRRNSLFELIELFNFLITLKEFWDPISNDATGFFFLWRICQANRIFKMGS